MRGPLDEALRDRRVLVTGHTGFKGSWLSMWLDRLEASVSGLALEPATDPAMYEVCGLRDIVDSTIADVGDLAAVKAVFARVQPEVVFHLAAQPIVRISYDEPVETYRTNVMGTVHVLEAARECASTRAVVVVTSDKCYENREWSRGYREDDSLGGKDPYSSSKACAEIVTAAYANSFFGPHATAAAVTTARAGNVVGGGDWSPDRLIPDAARALARGDELAVRNPGHVRPWQHVLEPLGGYLMLATRLLESEAGFDGSWNFGPHEDSMCRVECVIDRFVTMWGSGHWKDMSDRNAPHEAGTLKLDSTKAHRDLGWQPVLDLDSALRLTVDWYKCFYSHGDVRSLTYEQIEAYEQSVAAAGD
ncbi:MAG: CDP-glucose 4,6-dehydratase [Actinomycetota bacterium]|nr:CDP-glucose 4,6-dehydratase [Actinomycetota bacterium]